MRPWRFWPCCCWRSWPFPPWQPGVTPGGHSTRGNARFEGRTIDLRTGWGDARACVVWHQDGETDCFRTDEDAEQAVTQRDRAVALAALHAVGPQAVRPADWRLAGPAVPQVGAISTCADWLTLYEHVGFAGRSLRFHDQSIYQDLADWGFAAQTSSYRIGGCATTLRDSGWDAYPGSTGAGDTAASMLSGWNDRIRYLRIS